MSAAAVLSFPQQTRTFLAIYDSLLDEYGEGCRAKRHAFIMSALVYRANVYGNQLHLTTAAIRELIRGYYCGKVIRETLRELEADGRIADLKPDGRGFRITLRGKSSTQSGTFSVRAITDTRAGARVDLSEKKKQELTTTAAKPLPDDAAVAVAASVSLPEASDGFVGQRTPPMPVPDESVVAAQPADESLVDEVMRQLHEWGRFDADRTKFPEKLAGKTREQVWIALRSFGSSQRRRRRNGEDDPSIGLFFSILKGVEQPPPPPATPPPTTHDDWIAADEALQHADNIEPQNGSETNTAEVCEPHPAKPASDNRRRSPRYEPPSCQVCRDMGFYRPSPDVKFELCACGACPESAPIAMRFENQTLGYAVTISGNVEPKMPKIIGI